jgi:hypothetical protein
VVPSEETQIIAVETATTIIITANPDEIEIDFNGVDFDFSREPLDPFVMPAWMVERMGSEDAYTAEDAFIPVPACRSPSPQQPVVVVALACDVVVAGVALAVVVVVVSKDDKLRREEDDDEAEEGFCMVSEGHQKDDGVAPVTAGLSNTPNKVGEGGEEEESDDDCVLF